MCEPTTIALTSLALTATGVGASLYGQKEQADAQAQYQGRAVAEGSAIAHNDFEKRASAVQMRLTQEEEAASQKIGMNNIDAAKAISTARVAAGEAGVQGNSVDALYADFRAQQENFTNSIETNVRNGRAQFKNDVKGIQSQGNNSLAALRFAPIQGPNYLAGAAQIGAAGLDSYTRYQINRTPSANSQQPEAKVY